jgi:hypothetical protein
VNGYVGELVIPPALGLAEQCVPSMLSEFAGEFDKLDLGPGQVVYPIHG